MNEPAFRFCDDLGPKSILHVYQPSLGMQGIVVVDNVATGPAIGGTRMAADATLEECFRLARAMTFKNAAAGLPHGGAKSVIIGDPNMPMAEKEQWIRAFARSIEGLTDYIPGPDMGTDETAMAWVKDEIGRSAGLPREIGGIPLDEIGATGFGLVIAAEAAKDYCDLALAGARIAIQGFGAVGRHAARFLAERGAVLVAAADSSATVHVPDGIDVDALSAHKLGGGSIKDFATGEKLPREAIIGIDCDILIPAARPDFIRADNEAQLRARLIVPGANIGVTEEAEIRLHDRGVLCLPDFIANAGGVICAAVEYHGGTEVTALDEIAEKIARNTREVLGRVRDEGVVPRQAAIDLARRRVEEAMALRRAV